MTGLLCYAVAAFGLAYIVGHSLISRRPREWLYGANIDPPVKWREWRRLLVDWSECPACFGFWAGLVVGFAGPVIFLAPNRWVGALAGALFTSGSNYLLARATGLMPPPTRSTP